MTSHPHAHHWPLNPDVVHLNHGSFGACPIPVLESQAKLRAQMEWEPLKFFTQDLEGLLDRARAELATFVGTTPAHLAFVPNATTGVNSVVRSLHFDDGDEILTTNQSYNACQNALEFVAHRAGGRVRTVPLPFPLSHPGEIVERIVDALTPQTKLAMIDHITSPTGLVLPIGEIVSEVQGRGVDVLVDGAHGPGMVALDLDKLGAAYYTGNCHKWLCSPKGAAFLHVRDDRAAVRPLVISHGANDPRRERSRYHLEFDWTGTSDPTPYLSIPACIDFLGGLLPGGWDALMARNRAMALEGRNLLAETLEEDIPAPDEMIGTLGAIPLPPGKEEIQDNALPIDPLGNELYAAAGIVVPVFPWPEAPQRLLRVSAQAYNEREDYEALANALREALSR